jgi:hypothetical protein
VDFVPDPALFRTSGSTRNGTRDNLICTHELFSKDHRGGHGRKLLGSKKLSLDITRISIEGDV